jgi:hypothetical protein
MNPELKIRTVKEIKIPEATVSLREDGIVYVHYNKNTLLDVKLQKRMLEVFNEITGKKKSHFIFDAAEGLILTKEARDNAIVMEDQTPVLATAVVANNLGYRIIANFYIKVNKPKGKYKVVTSVEEGALWLNSLES